MRTRILQWVMVCILLNVFYSTELQAQRVMEKLDRGLVAVKVNNGVFLSWRVFGKDNKDISFNIYRDGTKVNATPIIGATNLTDAAGTTNSKYTVKPIIGGVEQATGGSAVVWASQTHEINLTHRPGTSYTPNDINVGDLDGDGQYELVVKWYPNNAQDNANIGITNNTLLAAYKLDGTFIWIIDLGENIRSGAHYTQHLVADFDNDGKAEVICKTAPRTKDAGGNYLKTGPAASGDTKIYRDDRGIIATGPEYLTIFNGQTGLEMATVNFQVGRGDPTSWGKTSENYNRVDRFNSTIAYLDGKKPSAVFNRGYYAKLTLSAWDWDGKTLSNKWIFNSSTNGNGAAAGQGNHNLSCGDVDGDGFDEIILGACAIDNDGKLMYATGLSHGDAMHLGEMDLDNPGLEVFCVHEENKSDEIHDARTGKVLWRNAVDGDNGRGVAADIDAGYPGYEMWSAKAAGVKTSKNKQVSANKPSMNFRVYWDGDLQDELLDGNKIDKWNGNGTTRLITLTGNSCNGSKSTPNLCADIIGDWREEVILHDGASKLYFYTTTIPTNYKLYTLMHDPVYRNAISWQQSAYNQPPHLGFFLGSGVDKAPVPNIIYPNSTTTDCNGIENGSAYQDQCGICVGGNTGKVPCIVDCNGDPNGTASLDKCGICSGGNTVITPCTGAIQAEDFCEADGVVENTNAGFIGEGYLNFNNEIGASGMWKLYSETAISAKITVVYANGGTTARPMTIAVNETQQGTFTGASSGNWTDYKTEELTVNLVAGVNSLTLTSTSVDGGPNIDAFLLNNTKIKTFECDSVIIVKSIKLKAGWNIIGYPFEESKKIEDALSGILSKVEVVKDYDGFWLKSNNPALNSLTELKWSKGYLIKVNEACELIW